MFQVKWLVLTNIISLFLYSIVKPKLLFNLSLTFALDLLQNLVRLGCFCFLCLNYIGRISYNDWYVPFLALGIKIFAYYTVRMYAARLDVCRILAWWKLYLARVDFNVNVNFFALIWRFKNAVDGCSRNRKRRQFRLKRSN